MIPAILLSKPALYAGGVVAVLTVGGIWFKAHDNRVKREAIVNEQIRQSEEAIVRQDSVITALQDTLEEARKQVDTVVVRTTTAGTNYTRQRASVNTTAPQPPGVPTGSVVVPIAFVQAADSLAKLVPELLATIRIEREASTRRIAAGDSTIVLLRVQNEQLKLAVEAAKPGITDRLKWLGIGGAVVLGGLAVMGRN